MGRPKEGAPSAVRVFEHEKRARERSESSVPLNREGSHNAYLHNNG